jgi:phenylalanyl-tRNA synthetase beta chain
MVELGQPMHAQDLAKLKKREVTLRQAKPGESVKTILGTTVNLDKDIFVLSSGGVPTVIGGIVGGSDTSVTNETTEIILDAGNYDQSVIRKNSRKLKIINETVSRYDKFLHPDLCETALDRATYLLETIVGATVYLNVDYYPNPQKPNNITLRFARLQSLSGMDIPIKEVKRILTALEYKITKESSSYLTLTIPYFRTDVEVEDDVVADILRINDYSYIPTSPLTTPVPNDITPKILIFEEHLKDLLVAQGAHEHTTASLVKESGVDGEILLSNALSIDQNALRHSAIPMLKEVQLNYAKHQLTQTVLFEIGKSFELIKGKYQEKRELYIVGKEVSQTLATLMKQLGIKYLVNKEGLILVGIMTVGLLEFDALTLSTELLLINRREYVGIISEFNHRVKRDLSLITPTNISYYDIASAIEELKPNFSYNCKSVAKVAGSLNYLLNFMWTTESDAVDTELSKVIAHVTNKLNIQSKT